MAVTPDIHASQGAAFAVTNNTTTHDIHAAQADVLAIYNIPSKNMKATQARAQITFHEAAGAVRVPQAKVFAVVSGRQKSPQIRAFTFTLDGHDFYGLRLGDTSTILYDLSSQEWVEWTSEDLPFWRVNCATNWIGAQAIGYQHGNSDIVVGDDTWGLLYFLDPTQPYDDAANVKASEQMLAFPRIAMAQTTVSGRNYVPCYAIFLSGDNYGINSDFTPFVQLETSDDQGRSWTNHGIINAQPDIMDQDYRWTSLGQMQSPGRLFRITDNGILTRIDSLEMNDA